MVFTYGKARQELARPRRRAVRYRKRRNIVKRVRDLEVQTEKKFLDTSSGTLQPTTAGVLTLINGVVQGDTSITRDGDLVTWTSLYFQISLNAYTAGDHSNVRVLIVQDKQTNGLAITMAKLFSLTTAILNINSPLNLDNSFRYNVLCDKVFQINDNGKDNVHFKKYIKMQMRTRYNAAQAGITEITTNSIFVIVFGDVALGDYQWISRMRFIDG